MSFTSIRILHQFQTDGGAPAQGFLTAVLSEDMTNGGVTVGPTPVQFALDPNGNLDAQVFATDDSTTTSADSNPLYTFYLQLAGQSVVIITSAIPSGLPRV